MTHTVQEMIQQDCDSEDYPIDVELRQNPCSHLDHNIVFEEERNKKETLTSLLKRADYFSQRGDRQTAEFLIQRAYQLFDETDDSEPDPSVRSLNS